MLTMDGVEDYYPLSPMQEGMLFYEVASALHVPGADVGFQQVTGRIDGPLNLLAFRQAWQQVINRHPMLRTGFVWEGLKKPVQVVHRRAVFPFDVEDWRGMSGQEHEDHLQAARQADRQRGFYISQPPLMRLTLFRMEEERWAFMWSYHHILLDGWSLSIVLGEVLRGYEAYRQGSEWQLGAGRPYLAFVTWLQRQDLGQARQFWRRRLQGFQRPTPLGGWPVNGATRSSRDLAISGSGPAVQQAALSEGATASLTGLARHSKLSLSTLVQGAWAILLQRSSRQPEVLFGLTVAGRPVDLEGAETIVGLFINNVPVRVQFFTRDLARGTLLDFLKHLQSQQAEMRLYEQVSPRRIQEWSEVPRQRRLYDSLLVFENYPLDDTLQAWVKSLPVGGLQASVRTGYPLTLVAAPGGKLSFQVVYEGSRFTEGEISGLLSDLVALMEKFSAGLDVPLSHFLLAADMEMNELSTEPARRREPGRPGYLAPRDALELQLTQILEEALDVRPVGIRDNYFDLGGHSLGVLYVIERIQAQFGRKLPLSAFVEATTIEALAGLLRRQAGPQIYTPLLAIQSGGSPPPFFCVHPAGGAALCYIPLARSLGSNQPFYGLQAAGLDGDQEPPGQIEELAAVYVRAIQEVQPAGPYFLGGWSMGGTVAFEMARQLAGQGQRTALLVLFDSRPPAAFRASAGNSPPEESLLAEFLSMMGVYLGVDPERLWDQGFPRELEETLDFLLKQIPESPLFLSSLDQETVRRFYWLWQRHYAALSRYTPVGLYPGAVTLLQASQPPPAGLQQLFQLDHREGSDAAGWQAVSARPLAVYNVPGNHYTLLSEPHVQALADTLSSCLAQARAMEGSE
jgi:thioesterase domain-containing protein